MSGPEEHVMSGTPTQAPHRHRLTVGDYYRMAEAGILPPEERVELIEGEIIDVPPPGSRHAGTIDHLVDILKEAVGRRAIVRSQNPLRLDDYTEPQPDIVLLRPRPDFYKSSHPNAKDVLLVIEVADTSLRYDRDVKVLLYARHGIPEVWLIKLDGEWLTRHRDPREGMYQQVDQPSIGSALDIAALADLRVELGEVFDG
jgi:Uma2 family endonuclease